MNTVTSQTRQRLYALTRATESIENKLETWSKMKCDHVEKMTKENSTLVSRGEEHVTLLKRKHQETLVNITNLEKTLKQECEKEDVLKQSIKESKGYEKQQSNEIPSLVQQLSQLSLQYQQMEHVIQNNSNSRHGTEQEMETKISMIQKYMGLSFEPIPNVNLLKVVFQHVRREECSFCVAISNGYKVSNFCPPIQVPMEYIQELNVQNNFGVFLGKTRRLFREYQ
jgi:hypothetical protein